MPQVQPHFEFTSSLIPDPSTIRCSESSSYPLPLDPEAPLHTAISPFPSCLLNQLPCIRSSHLPLALPAPQHSRSFLRTHMELAVSGILTPSPFPASWALLEKVINAEKICSITRRRPFSNLSGARPLLTPCHTQIHNYPEPFPPLSTFRLHPSFPTYLQPQKGTNPFQKQPSSLPASNFPL